MQSNSIELGDVRLGNALMSYVQYVIQLSNAKLFHEIIDSEEGCEDFLSSRDAHGNTCLHYVALYDSEDIIDAIFNLCNNKSGMIERL